MKQHLLYKKPSGTPTIPITPDILHIYADNPDNDIDSNNKVVSMANDYGNNSVDVSTGGALRLDYIPNKQNGLPSFKAYDSQVHKVTNVFGDGSIFNQNDFTFITVTLSDNYHSGNIPRYLGFRNSDSNVFIRDDPTYDLAYNQPSIRFDNGKIYGSPPYTFNFDSSNYPQLYSWTHLIQTSSGRTKQYFNDQLWLDWYTDQSRLGSSGIASDTLYIGMVRYPDNRGFGPFHHFELIIYSWLLSESEILSVYDYLNNKWSIS